MDDDAAGAKPYTRGPIDWPAAEEAGAPAREEAIKGWLPLGEITCLAGRRGIGTSLLAHQIATALAIGHDFIAPVEQERKVLVWDCEYDQNELIRRQIALCEYYGVRLMDLDKRLIVEPLAEIECALVDVVLGKLMRTPMAKELREQTGDYKAEQLVLDPISRLFGGNEMDPHHVGKFISVLNWIRSPTGAGVLLGGDLAKRRTKYGAAPAWEDCCRDVLYFGDKPPYKVGNESNSENTRDLRYLSKHKDNYTSRDLCTMVLDQGVYTIITASTTINKPQARAVVLSAIARLTGMGIIGTDSTLAKLITEYNLHEGLPRRELANATRQLRSEKVILRQQVGVYANRTPRFGLVIA